MSILKRSVFELQALLADGDLSPSDLVSESRRQCEQQNPAINAFTSFDWEGAHRRAKALEATGFSADLPLYGMPVAIKDNFYVAGQPTTWGSLAFKDFVADRTDVHVQRLIDAGAIVVGKTNLPEFALGGQTVNALHGVTRNPLNPKYSVAGSSGGAVAALAGDMVVLADGSDLGGSIRTPAAFTGTCGFRPTTGVVPILNRRQAYWSWCSVGPMAKSMDELILMLDLMAGYVPGTEFVSPKIDPEASVRGLRVAWCLEPGGMPTSPHVKAALGPLKDQLIAAGVSVVEADPEIKDIVSVQHASRALNTAIQIADVIEAHPDVAFGREARETCDKGLAVTAAEIVAGERVRTALWTKLQTFWQQFDLCVWPTACSDGYAADLAIHEVTEDWRPVEMTAGLQLPALSVPYGRSQGSGLPVGAQVVGPAGSDGKILALGRAIEAANRS